MNAFELNYLIVTIDSCRWDTFVNAGMNELTQRCVFMKSYSQGTYTLPSHKSIYQGILPNIYENLPYYNRFSKNVFRIANRNAPINSLVSFPKGTQDIIKGFQAHHYHTFGIGATEWFLHRELISSFENFHFTGINVAIQIEIFFDIVKKLEKPFFSLLNIGETHEPYEYGFQITPSLESRARMRQFNDSGFHREDHRKQIYACKYVVNYLENLCKDLENYNRGTVVIICSDHGECFGEDGMYGHGFYHQKVMEVPLGIFGINCTLP